MKIVYCKICGLPFHHCFCNRETYQIDYYSTGNPEYVGDCSKCGYPCFRGVWHECSTAPKPKNQTTNGAYSSTDIRYNR